MKNLVFILALVNLFTQSFAEQKILELRGQWKFSVGDHKEWANTNYDDADWETIRVPSTWEDQGFYGYDGFAWYRKSIVIPEQYKASSFILYLGYIDDADEVYVNGQLVGFSGGLPPKYSTAYNSMRKYEIPNTVLNFDKPNIIAVRVYDATMGGGIVSGETALYIDDNPFPMEISLKGMWKFKTDDNPDYSNPAFNDTRWRSIYAPKYWEEQGYRDYDGYAWYRKSFNVTKSYENDRIVVVLGKIDDFDEVYLNGNLISVKRVEDYDNGSDRYSQLRAYYISGKLLIPNKTNIIAVRVLDRGGDGGIYEGPLGIVKQKDFINFWRMKKQGSGNKFHVSIDIEN
jgi:sialate O-acetylesterase